MSYDPITQPVDYILLAQQRSPGIARVKGAGSPRKWDERGGYGLSGSTLVFTGTRLSEFDVQLLFTTPEDWAAWDVWKPLVARPPSRVRPRALDIWHPWLEELEIKRVVVLDVLQPDEGETGEWTRTIKFKAFRAPKLTLAKPEGSKSKPTDPVDAYIEQLTGQFQRAARGEDTGPLPPLPKL